jgi:hypothetical protein
MIPNSNPGLNRTVSAPKWAGNTLLSGALIRQP